jgi:hypothetical protein
LDLQIIWPAVSGLIGFQLLLGAVIGFLERWSVSETIYFTFVTALTIGYGDLGACPSNSGFCWSRKGESDSVPWHEQDISPVED